MSWCYCRIVLEHCFIRKSLLPFDPIKVNDRESVSFSCSLQQAVLQRFCVSSLYKVVDYSAFLHNDLFLLYWTHVCNSHDNLQSFPFCFLLLQIFCLFPKIIENVPMLFVVLLVAHVGDLPCRVSSLKG